MCGQEGLARVTGECVVPASKTLSEAPCVMSDKPIMTSLCDLLLSITVY